MDAIATATETRDQFLQLLVTQLRHQDPLEPTKQEDFLSQLAQFSTLEGIENLNSNLDTFLSSQLEGQAEQNSFLVELQQFQNMASAASMVGKTIEFEVAADAQTEANADAEAVTASGVVEAVVIEDGLVSKNRPRSTAHLAVNSISSRKMVGIAHSKTRDRSALSLHCPD